ncbi:STAS domain-containing protein [Streptomyces sp. WG-D5]
MIAVQLGTAGPHDGVLGLRVTGALDFDTCDIFIRQATRILDAHPALRALELDCSHLSGIDSMGLSTLLALRRRLDKDHVTLNLTRRSARLEQLLTITGTLDYLHGETAPAAGAPPGPGR